MSTTPPVPPAGTQGPVLHFTDTVAFGGAERALLTLIAQLRGLGIDQAVMLHPHAPAALICGLRAGGVPVSTVAPLPPGLIGFRRLPRFVARLRAAAPAPAIFHAHLTMPLACKFGLLGAQLTRVPAIVATEQLMLDFSFDRSARLQQRIVARGVDRFIAVSSHVAASLAALGWPRDKLTVIPNAIDVNRFAVDAGGGSGRARVVLTVGRLDPQKGHEHLIDAAAHLPDVEVRIVGDGPERGRLEALARRSPAAARIAFLGERDDIPELLADCAVFAFPSLYEGLPLALLEAMAARRPIVASAIGGVDEIIVPEQTGLLVPPTDAHALAAAIRRLLNDPVLSRRLGEQAHELVRERYGQARLARDVAALYRSVAGEAGLRAKR